MWMRTADQRMVFDMVTSPRERSKRFADGNLQLT